MIMISCYGCQQQNLEVGWFSCRWLVAIAVSVSLQWSTVSLVAKNPYECHNERSFSDLAIVPANLQQR